MKIYLEPFSKGEIAFTVKGDVAVDELVAYVKEKLEGVLEFKEASYEENGELVFEFESSVEDVIYNVTIVDKRVTITAENIKEENDPAIIYTAQKIVDSFKDINVFFRGRKVSISRFRFNKYVNKKATRKDRVEFRIF